jgi:hypothetical protein
MAHQAKRLRRAPSRPCGSKPSRQMSILGPAARGHSRNKGLDPRNRNGSEAIPPERKIGSSCAIFPTRVPRPGPPADRRRSAARKQRIPVRSTARKRRTKLRKWRATVRCAISRKLGAGPDGVHFLYPRNTRKISSETSPLTAPTPTLPSRVSLSLESPDARHTPRTSAMNSTHRSAVGIISGLLVFAMGFWLHFHTSDFMTYQRSDGVEFAPYAHVFQDVAGLGGLIDRGLDAIDPATAHSVAVLKQVNTFTFPRSAAGAHYELAIRPTSGGLARPAGDRAPR